MFVGKPLVGGEVLGERVAEAHVHRALDLALAQQRVDGPADVVDGDDLLDRPRRRGRRRPPARRSRTPRGWSGWGRPGRRASGSSRRRARHGGRRPAGTRRRAPPGRPSAPPPAAISVPRDAGGLAEADLPGGVDDHLDPLGLDAELGEGDLQGDGVDALTHLGQAVADLDGAVVAEPDAAAGDLAEPVAETRVLQPEADRRRPDAPDLRPGGRIRACSPAGSPPLRARQRARSSSAPATAVRRAADGRGRDPRPAVHRGRRRRRLPCRPRDPHRRGRQSSHAALVARGMGRPCVAGATVLEIDAEKGVVAVGETELHAGDLIAIDGSSGLVTVDEVELIEPRISDEFDRVLEWPTRSAGSACAPTPTRPRTPPGRAGSAPRGSASAAPSTCSSARTARSWCARCSSRASAGAARGASREAGSHGSRARGPPFARPRAARGAAAGPTSPRSSARWRACR